MNGELAQAIAIALHGTRWLADPIGSPPDLEATSSFQYVRSARFGVAPPEPPDPTATPPLLDDWLAEQRRPHPVPTGGSSIGEWLRDLRRDGVERIWLVAPVAVARLAAGEPVADHQLAAFAGGGRWALVTTTAGGEAARAWPASWAVGDQQAPDQRIWDVAYASVPGPPLDAAALGPTVADASAVLRDALVATEAFARANGVEDWADVFADASAFLDAPDPLPRFHDDMLPDGLELDRRRLAAAAAGASVFGGMGSWNDLGFERPEPQRTYDQLTASLYRAHLDALVAVVNTGGR